MYSRQASLILRVLKDGKTHYFVQVRDNRNGQSLRFPGTFGLFGGELKEGEKPEEGFFREMREELAGIDFKKLAFEHRIYNWKNDLERVDGEINGMLNGNFNVLRGFLYGEKIPQEALHTEKSLTYRDLITAATEDHYFVGDVTESDIKKITVLEGKRWELLPASFCKRAIFYPTDKLALLHDMVKRENDK